ncbi:hypothetical protein NVP1076O_04 [Vibrio phage 1.076.O._10N.286.51.B7]|nr:hypothetical protein NVP1076O_04 [Vibrio phage 1.076.O._10N.286.51.B7]
MKNSDMPAMPITNNELACAIVEGDNKFGGLTKREHFAGLIMQGLLSAPSEGEQVTSAQLTTKAVTLADLLLAELEK